MKTFLLILFLFLSLTAKSQYLPFPTTNTTWVYQYYNDFHQPTGAITTYRITGDTIRLGRSYKKISGCSVIFGCNSGGIRDSNKVIYFIPDTSSMEYVLYDFNLEAGDTLSYPQFGDTINPDPIIVYTVDSIWASDGPHRRWFFNTLDMWIEGIGSTHYLFLSTSCMGLSGNDKLECIWTDSGFSYEENLNCLLSTDEHSERSDEITVSPNPAQLSDEISISASFAVREIRVYNTYGAVVYLKSSIMTTTHSLTFYCNKLTRGIYFLQVIGIEKTKTIKFIID